MKLEHIVALAVRLFAIAVAIYSLKNGISLVPYFSEQGWLTTSYFYAIFMVSLLLLSIYLWMFPLTVTRNLIKFREPGETDISSANAEQVQIVAFTVLGIYLLFYVLSDLVYWAVILFVSGRDSIIQVEITTEQRGLIISTLVELAFVLFLLLGPKRISVLLHNIRYGKDQ